MNVPLDPRSEHPLYLQIRDYFSRLIQSEKLVPGDRLPSIRSLSQATRVNKLTVIEAYSVLEADGLIHARQGAGYFVNRTIASVVRLKSTFNPDQKVIIQEQGSGSFVQQFTASLQAQKQGNILDFSSGFPRVSVSEELQRITRRAVAEATDSLFKYDFPEGQVNLRKQIAQLLLQQGLEVSPESLIVTSGSEQALALVMRYTVRSGDWVVVETPTYHGALAILENLGARVIGIPMTVAGMNLDLLEQYLQSHRPALIYTISTLHNPTGLTTSQQHRQRLLALAEQYECLILEDNAYEGLNFEPAPPPIKALDSHDRVIYTGTFSKTLMPGLRIGYMVVTGADYNPLLEQKVLHDLHTSGVSQAIVSEILASGHYRRYLNRLRTTNLQSRNTMLQALERYFPEEVSWTIPNGGLFLWTHLPDRLSLPILCREALAHQILISNGAAFFPGQQGYPAMRLNFCQSPQEIDRGLALLGDLMKRHLSSGLISKTLTPVHLAAQF
ncbi:GntR family transcriptional regulator [Leptolyngbya sp. 'hensonii']|uniref:aminotransferase-like domain-containing protein n=1 Tax=Leptolyngbya sp. 'hensonii' TaxID=1922337 RepID=UPI00094F9043|nr:PLP-dependent aminotransferase family protein [Leptolyngbya sp. 'hensonii']OLP16880.1 GntR family transcriptional regulator [Leptolyngbya sp. 'hensonii']